LANDFVGVGSQTSEQTSRGAPPDDEKIGLASMCDRGYNSRWRPGFNHYVSLFVSAVKQLVNASTQSLNKGEPPGFVKVVGCHLARSWSGVYHG
jgi:hypothetical protein